MERELDCWALLGVIEDLNEIFLIQIYGQFRGI